MHINHSTVQFTKLNCGGNCVCQAPTWLSPGGSDGKESARNAGDGDSIPGWGRSPGGGHGNPLQCSCLENPRDRGGWRATVRGVAGVRRDGATEHTQLPVPSVCDAAPPGISPSVFSWKFPVSAPEALSEGSVLCQSPCPYCCSLPLALCTSDVSQTASGFLPRFTLDPGEVTSPSVARVFTCSQ